LGKNLNLCHFLTLSEKLLANDFWQARQDCIFYNQRNILRKTSFLKRFHVFYIIPTLNEKIFALYCKNKIDSVVQKRIRRVKWIILILKILKENLSFSINFSL